MRPSSEAATRRAASDLLGSHGQMLLRIARRHSLGPEDAEDALQRAAEIMLTKAPSLEPGRLIAWMAVVTKHEAMAVRRSRERLLRCLPAEATQIDPLDVLASDAPQPSERAERTAAVAEAQRALATLKANERIAILLQAEGYSYAEICEMLGWTYTKVNRCLAEGRAKLRGRGSPAPQPRS
jgi:RNA polymerase sigma factor (sigma-70 family)